MIPGMPPAGRPGQFPAQGQQGRGGPNGIPQMSPAYGMPGQMPFGGMPQGGPGFSPNFGYPQAMAQVQAQFGRGQGGRGQMPGGMPNMQSLPQQMMGNPNGMRGRDVRPQQFPPPQGRAAMGMGMGMPPGQMPGFPQPGRGGPMMGPAMGMPSGIPLGPSLEQIMQANPGQQKQLLGESLFPKIQMLHPSLAGKITGMLLEMENSELFGL